MQRLSFTSPAVGIDHVCHRLKGPIFLTDLRLASPSNGKKPVWRIYWTPQPYRFRLKPWGSDHGIETLRPPWPVCPSSCSRTVQRKQFLCQWFRSVNLRKLFSMRRWLVAGCSAGSIFGAFILVLSSDFQYILKHLDISHRIWLYVD